MRRLGLLALLGMAGPAAAGPLRDLLRERKGAGSTEPEDGTEAAGAGSAALLPPGATLLRDLAFGPDDAQRLDVYRPAQASKSPVLFFVHGGGWRRGDKAMGQMVRNKVPHWLAKGFVFVSTNYRMLPAADVLVQADDVARALAYVQAHAAEWGGDPARVVVMGHSAGAHLVALMTADGNIASRQGAKSWLATVALDSAALDMVAIMNRRHYRFYDSVFGTDPTFWRDASPTHRLTAKPAAPMLMVCSSSRDDACPPARAFADKAQGYGGRVAVLPVPLSHLQINDQLGLAGDYTSAVDAFLQTVGIG